PEWLYRHVCHMPCEAPIRLGTSVFAAAMSDTDLHPREILMEDRVEGPRTLRLRWNDRGLFRLIGGLVFGIGGAIGVAGVVTGTIAYVADAFHEPWNGVLVGGAVLTAVSLGVGLTFLFWEDDMSLEVSTVSSP